MPVGPTDLKHFKAANHPSTDTDLVGGAISAVEITGTVVGEVYPSGSVIAQAAGGADDSYYYKSFLKNAHATQPLLGALVWLLNALAQLSAASKIRLQSTSASDDSTKKVRLYGLVGGSIVTEDVVLNGTTPVVSTNTYAEHYRSVILLVADGSLSTAVGDIQIKRDADAVLLGIIPGSAGSGQGTAYSWATAEFDIGLAASQNDAGTTANRKTAPGGVAFARPNTEAAALAVPGTDLGATSAIGVWWKWLVKAGMTPPLVSGLQVIPIIKGLTT
jgi:hypothetical protein